MTVIKPVRGAALIEYGILVGLISVVSISAVFGLEMRVSDTFSEASESLAMNFSNEEPGSDNPPALPPGSVAWEIVTTPTFRGYNEYHGTLKVVHSGPFELSRTHSQDVSKTYLYLVGDVSAEVQDYTYTCNGVSGKVSEAHGNARGVYSSSSNETAILWPGNGPVFSANETYYCTFTK